ncbi:MULTISPECIES: histidine kinase [Methylobacteriaceae]|uniref:sensor histidine kinase n=1 Tax=Methylobacteriaceae TaxID=119045 RepID=UPI00074F9650|nr:MULTISPECIES: histidine kinase [Methylobacteriaceae]AMB44491.1 regulator of cell autolysis [Methylobacterium sp. AMS5]TFZ60601.1 sensor histidine kinase [Methylorubrum sp. Q1]
MTDERWAARLPDFWQADLVGFALLVIVSIFVRVPLYGDAGAALTITLLVDPVCLLAALLMRHRLTRPNEPVRGGLPRGLVVAIRVVLRCVGAAILLAVWVRLICLWGNWSVPHWLVWQSWATPIGFYAIVLLIWTLTYLWWHERDAARTARQRAAQAETEALRLELTHLRQQLDPHFLFNALNGIAAEIPVHPAAATAMVCELADYLRYSLEQRDRTVMPLRREIEAVDSYLAIQKARFGPGLRYVVEIDEAAQGMLTPSFLLQPLVENAIKHGATEGKQTRYVHIAARSGPDGLALSISNPGRLDPRWRTKGNPGVGLAVLRRRLELLYPLNHRFDLRQVGGDVVAELSLAGSPCCV